MHSLFGIARDRTWDLSIPSRTFYHCSTATSKGNRKIHQFTVGQQVEQVTLIIHCVEKKCNEQCFRHNFDNHKYVVVMFAWNVVKRMWTRTNTINGRHLNSVTILPCELNDHQPNVIIRRKSHRNINMQLFDSTNQRRFQRPQLLQCQN